MYRYFCLGKLEDRRLTYRNFRDARAICGIRGISYLGLDTVGRSDQEENVNFLLVIGMFPQTTDFGCHVDDFTRSDYNSLFSRLERKRLDCKIPTMTYSVGC